MDDTFTNFTAQVIATVNVTHGILSNHSDINVRVGDMSNHSDN